MVETHTWSLTVISITRKIGSNEGKKQETKYKSLEALKAQTEV